MKTFAAINVGSYEQTLKIYTITKNNGIREVDWIRNRLDLGGTFATGKLSHEVMDELCAVLRNFVSIMEGYRVDDYRACATSAIRETKNTAIVLDQIMQRTGVKLDVLSNSEQRFLDYKSIASRGGFEKIIEKGTLVLDIGGGSIQMSLFDKDKLSATQNMRLGVLRLQEKMSRLNVRPSENGPLLEELLEAQLSVFRKMYLKDRVIENIIVVDDYISALILGKLGKVAGSGYLDRDSMASYMNYLHDHTDMEIVRYFDTPEENVPLLRISSAIVRQVALMTDAKMIWAPGVSLCDGMVYEYAEEYKLLAQVHDFEQDIVTCARGISKRYIENWIRTELELRKEKAHYFIQEWLHSEIDLLNFTKGYLKEKVRFYSDSHFSRPLRAWEKFLGHSKPVSIIISKSKTELEQKLEWFTYKGSGAILKAYKFLYDNNLLHEYEKSNYLALNNMEYPPDLASGLIERAILFKREDLIPTIKENIKRRD